MKRWSLVATFLLFVALCASAAYWALELFKPQQRPVTAPPAAQAEINTGAAASLFGGRPGKAAVASNYQLKGVIFSGRPQEGVAILSADGKPAQALGVGMEVVPGVTVKEVRRDYVLLSENGVSKRVELPEDAKAQEQLGTASPVGVAPVPTRPGTPPSASTQPTPGQSVVPRPAPPPVQSAHPPMPPQQAQPQPMPTPVQPAPVQQAAPPTVAINPPQPPQQGNPTPGTMPGTPPLYSPGRASGTP
jgi:general secretion pathway protein C